MEMMTSTAGLGMFPAERREYRPIKLTEEELAQLHALLHSPSSSPALRRRAGIVLALAAGEDHMPIARRLQVHPSGVRRWHLRFQARRMEALLHLPDHGIARSEERKAVERLLRIVSLTEPKRPGVRWNLGKVRAAAGLQTRQLLRIMKLFGAFTPRWTRARLKGEPVLLDKLASLGGLLLARQGRLLAMAVAEEGLAGPMAPAEPITQAPGVRLTCIAGRARGRCSVSGAERLGLRRAANKLVDLLQGQELTGAVEKEGDDRLAFLTRLDQSVPEELALLLVTDTPALMADPAVAEFLSSRPRIRVFQATSTQRWLHIVARMIVLLPECDYRHGAFSGTYRLITAIERFLTANLGADASFCWTANEETIRASLAAQGWRHAIADPGQNSMPS